MKNMVDTIEGNILTLKIDLDHVVDTSDKGNDIIAKTSNWEDLDLPQDHPLRIYRYSFRGLIMRKLKTPKNQTRGDESKEGKKKK